MLRLAWAPVLSSVGHRPLWELRAGAKSYTLFCGNDDGELAVYDITRGMGLWRACVSVHVYR